MKKESNLLSTKKRKMRFDLLSQILMAISGLLHMWPAWHCADLSIIIPNPKMQQKGYGTEAVRIMLDMAFDKYKMNRVSTGVVGLNTNALAFCSKLGFKQKGIQEQEYYYNNEYSDFYYDANSSQRMEKRTNPGLLY